jgi:hypothetical protein
MKLITKLSNLKWYKALPIWFILMTLFVFGLYKLIFLIGADPSISENPLFGNDLVLMKISLTLAIPFSLLIVFTQDQMKRSTAFWDRAEVVEREIDSATTLKELNRIITDEFSYETGVLRKMALGLPHNQKMREMYKIIETASKYLS